MQVCYLCKVRLRKNEGVLHILPSLPSGSQKRRICYNCHLRFHQDNIKFNSRYAKKYLKFLRAQVFNTKRRENTISVDGSYSDLIKEYF